MRNILLSYPKCGRTRLELLCLLHLTKYTGKSIPWDYLRWWCKFSHFGFQNINVPDEPSSTSEIDAFPDGSHITILTRKAPGILNSLYYYYQSFPPDRPEARDHVASTLDEFMLSKSGIGRLMLWLEKIWHLHYKVGPACGYDIDFITYEQTFQPDYIQWALPRVLGLKPQLPIDICKGIVNSSSVSFIKRSLGKNISPIRPWFQELHDGIQNLKIREGSGRRVRYMSDETRHKLFNITGKYGGYLW